MKFDSFISSPATTEAALKHWSRWSLALAFITLSAITILHIQAHRAYKACAQTCATCEKIATGSTTNPTTKNLLSQQYITINEQAAVVRNHLAHKAELAMLAHDLLKSTHAPVTLQSLTITERECTALFRCPPTYAVQTLTQKLATNNPQAHFHVTRLEQRDDALLATVTATFTPPATVK